ncbi:MAG: NAD(P)-dependent oxidoreductase [Nannocystaceae bacterium]
MSKIAFLGLGAMGVRMARRLLDGHELTVWSRTRARADALISAGARWADTPRAAAEGADVVISMVTDDEAAADVWLHPRRGAILSLGSGSVALECSTTTPRWIARLAAAATARGARLLDAPVAGSTPQAEAGQLAFLVGGDAATLEPLRALLARMGATILHAGAQTHGAILKLVVNSLFAGQVALMAELLRAVEAQGLAPARVVELLARLPVTAPAAVGAAQLMVAGDHASRFPTRLVIKDLRYAGELAPLPVVAAVRRRFEAAAARGRGDDNLTALHQETGEEPAR